MWPLLAVLLGLLAAVLPAPVVASGDAAAIREREIRECRADELLTWADGKDMPAPARALVFSYDPGNAPDFLPPDTVVPLIRRALAAWAPCGPRLDWAEWMPALASDPAARVVGWMPPAEDSGGLIGGADPVRRRLLLSPRIFTLLRERNAPRLLPTLQMTLAHEIGHFLGLVAHSRRCVDVTSYYDDGRGHRCVTANLGGIRSVKGLVEYRSELPTACDIARCQRANGQSP